MEDISRKIRLIRVEKGWTQKKLAQKTGISQATICRAETNCDNIKWNYVIKILTILCNKQSTDFLTQNLFVKEDEFIVFIQELKKHDRVWALINYDPKKTVQLFVKTIEKQFTFKKE